MCKVLGEEELGSRIAIFSFYDKCGVVDRYIEYLLEELKSVANRLIVVVNGNVDSKGRILFRKYTDEIIVRENIGFDAGAYTQILTKYLKEDEILQYDQLILCNDTFFGPFVKMDSIFDKMDERECDFWGLTFVNYSIFSFLHSYFLVFRNKIFRDRNFLGYFKNEIGEKVETIQEAYAVFERGLYHFLTQKGYIGSYFVDTDNYSPYGNPDICLKKGLPCIKKKSFENYEYRDNVLNALDMIKNVYDMTLIKEAVERVYQVDFQEFLERKGNGEYKEYKFEQIIIDETDIVSFIKKHKKIYIYGTGTFALVLWNYYKEYYVDFKGFIVSDNYKAYYTWQGQKVIHMKDVAGEAGIIIAMSKSCSIEVVNNLGHKSNYLYLWNV